MKNEATNLKHKQWESLKKLKCYRMLQIGMMFKIFQDRIRYYVFTNRRLFLLENVN